MKLYCLALAVTSAFCVATGQMAGMDMEMGMDMGSPPEAIDAESMPAPSSVRMPSCWGVNTAWMSVRWIVACYRIPVNIAFIELGYNAQSVGHCRTIHHLHVWSVGHCLHHPPALTWHLRCSRVTAVLVYAGGCFSLCSHGSHDAVD